MSHDGYWADCESCGLKAWDPQVSEMPGESNGQRLCLSCRRTCDTCRMTGATFEDFDSDCKTCKHCVRAESRGEGVDAESITSPAEVAEQQAHIQRTLK